MQVTNQVNYDQHVYETILKNKDAICEATIKRVAEDLRKENEANKLLATNGSNISDDCSVIYTFPYNGIIQSCRIRRAHIQGTIDIAKFNTLIGYYNSVKCHKIFTQMLGQTIIKMTTTPNYLYMPDLLLGIDQGNLPTDIPTKIKTRRMVLIENPNDRNLLLEFGKSLAKSVILQNALCLEMNQYVPSQESK